MGRGQPVQADVARLLRPLFPWPRLLVRLDRLWLLVVGQNAAKREIQSQVSPMRVFGGRAHRRNQRLHK